MRASTLLWVKPEQSEALTLQQEESDESWITEITPESGAEVVQPRL